MSTHCLRYGTLGTNECPVPNFPNGNVVVPSGAKRGVVVALHGFSVTPAPCPMVLADQSGILPVLWGTLTADLVADGWVVIQPTEVGDGIGTTAQTQAVYTDVVNDIGQGERHVNANLRWVDHAVSGIYGEFGTWPIVPVGCSWGGWHSLLWAAYRQSSIAGYVAHHPGICMNNFSPVFSSPVNFTGLACNGINLASSLLNSVTVPGLLGWGTADTVVDYPNSRDLLTPALYAAALAAGSPVSPNADGTGNATGYNGGGGAENHVLSTADVGIITGWFTSTIDPNCPAVH